MPRGKPSPKLMITVDPEVHARVVAAVGLDDGTARLEFLRQAGLAAVTAWEKKNGRFSKEEMEEARRHVTEEMRPSRRFTRSE